MPDPYWQRPSAARSARQPPPDPVWLAARFCENRVFHDGALRERRNARYLRSSSSSSAVRSSIAKAASLLVRPPTLPSKGNKYPAFSINSSQGTAETSDNL